jgi:hypothetical protein
MPIGEKPAARTVLAWGKLPGRARSAIRSFAVYLFGLAFRNALGHTPRTALTVVGIVVALGAFGLLHTSVAVGAGRSRSG